MDFYVDLPKAGYIIAIYIKTGNCKTAFRLTRFFLYSYHPVTPEFSYTKPVGIRDFL
jgi:hypothetical protein